MISGSEVGSKKEIVFVLNCKFRLVINIVLILNLSNLSCQNIKHHSAIFDHHSAIFDLPT